MASKETKEKPEEQSPRGFGDVSGLVLIGVALLLLVALFSYDKNDIAFNTSTPNKPEHNLIGWVGAHTAFGLFSLLGAAAYLLPVLLLTLGLGHFMEALAYLRKRWIWTAVLLVCLCGMLTQYTDDAALKAYANDPQLDAGLLERVSLNINAPSGGGYVGVGLDRLIFQHFGRVGALIVLFTLYGISLVFLTDGALIDWAREWWEKRSTIEPTSPAEAESQKLIRDKEKEIKQLTAQAVKAAKAETAEPSKPSGIGADLRPVPEPTVRDLSVPQPRPIEPEKKSARTKTKADEDAPPEIEGEVISAREVAAASVDDILGRKSDPKKTPPAAKSNEPVEDWSPSGSLPEPVTEDPATVAPVPMPPTAQRPKFQPKKPKPITVASTPLINNYQVPPMDFLQHADMSLKPTESKEELIASARLMQQTLAQFDIEVSVGDITKGPTITRYELHPAPGVKLEKIAALSNNIAAALKAERINILAPVPGKNTVGVEVPNLIKTKVIMRDLLESPEWQNTKARIPLALGKDVYGQPIIADLAEMPHLLIAGSTGSGKSVCINSIVASLLYRFSPDQLRFVMIDPKVVEMQQYNSLPHLVVPVVTDPKKVILALRWVVNEMEKRYQIFARVGVRNIKSFNERPKEKDAEKVRGPKEMELPLSAKKEKVEVGSDGFAVQLDEEIIVPRDEDIIIPEKLSYIVVIIDELADLMLVAPADVEMAIARITQMARAAGIHCIVATQRPSVDVITGVIKSNIPARIAFQVAAAVDSRTILDAKGADKLLGKGDMLYLPPGSARLIRAQGALITDQEIQQCVDFIAGQGKPSYEMEIHQQLQKVAPSFGAEESGCGEDEAIIEQCIEVIRSEQKASVSLLQRRLKLGYGRAARIMDELENRGIVGPSKGAEPRDILIDLDGGGADGAGQ